jgi:two-component system, OmpR family, alkaline phosphatase synthesis response regulator PhoP
MSDAKILVVEDDETIARFVELELTHSGFAVKRAGDGASALEAVQEEMPDLIVLDLMLPGLDGIEVCRRLRQFSDAYVLMLTARAEEVDKIVGLSVGADDYLTKPFSPRELVARVKAMLRRPRGPSDGAIGSNEPRHLGDLVIDSARHVVSRDGTPVDLTAREFALLAMLAEEPGRVFTRAQILERIWDSEFYDDHVVEVHIGNLRHKLEDDPARPRYVETVRGVGYRAAVSR